MTEPKARRLKVIADYINASFPGYEARIEQGYCDTDRKIGRGLRVAGKGRTGSRIIVTRKRKPGEEGHNVLFRPDLIIALDHNSAETYRTNSEVERWVHAEEKKLKLKPSNPGPWSW